jgi:hypothetical protein
MRLATLTVSLENRTVDDVGVADRANLECVSRDHLRSGFEFCNAGPCVPN